MEKVNQYASAVFAWLKGFKELVTIVVFIVLLVAFFSDTVRTCFGLFIAKHYGLKAYAYYEVDAGGRVSKPKPGIATDSCGRLSLLSSAKAADRQFEKIVVGARLQAIDSVNLRTEPNDGPTSSVITVLKGDSCVVVLEKVLLPPEQAAKKPEERFQKCVAISGGWFLVATAPCELFDRPKPFSG